MARWGDRLGKEAWSPWWPRDVIAMANAGLASPVVKWDFSGTNNQVAGVDEADRVKTDGQHLFVLAGDGVDIVTAWPAESLGVVSHVATAGDERALFLHAGRLTVISQEFTSEPAWPAATVADVRMACMPMFWQSRVIVTVVDVTDAARPAIRETTAIDGWLVDARAIAGRVVLVTQDNVDIPSPAIVPAPAGETPPPPSEAIGVPTIGIGAGPDCSGQVLVMHDLVGLSAGHVPRFVRAYADVGGTISAALSRWRDDVARRDFPGPAETLG